MLRHLTLSSLAVAATCGLAQAATLSNGSFELPGTFSGNFQNIPSGGSGLDSWTVGGAGIDLINTYWIASDLSYSLDLNGSNAGSITQTITDLIPGTTYIISFDLAGNPDGGNTVKSLLVEVGTSSYSGTFDFDTTGATRSDMLWEEQSFTFEAAGTSADLTFTSQDANPYGSALDNVSVSAVPLPAGVWLLGAGLGWLALRRRGA